MSYADLEQTHNTPEGRVPVEDLTGAATEIKSLLGELAGEIEDSRRRHSHALLQIERKLNAIEAGRPAGEELRNAGDHGSEDDLQFGPAGHANATDEAYDEDDAKSWLHERFSEISQHIAKSLSETRPRGTVHALGERLKQFHERVHDTLEDVARRSDVEGLRLIEAHVIELGHKLSDVQVRLSRLDTIEADLRTVMDEVSGEHLVRLSEHQDVLADVIDSTAAKTAEQLHQRMAQANAISAVDGGRFEELRGLIESAILQQRQAEQNAATAVSRAGAAAAQQQADGLSELKALVESSISERRKGEHDAMGMLDTVQQALVEVLDRIEALETRHAPAPVKAADPVFNELPTASPAPAAAADPALKLMPSPSVPAAPSAAKAERARAPAWDIPSVISGPSVIPGPSVTPASHLDAVDADEGDANLSPVERMRREFIADAQRAKLKAAANWAEDVKGEAHKGRKASGAFELPRVKILGMSPGLLVAALGFIVAINGGLLLFSRKTPAPPIAIEHVEDPLAHVPSSDRSDAASGAGTSGAEMGQSNAAEPGAPGNDAPPVAAETPVRKDADETGANRDQSAPADTSGNKAARREPTALVPHGMTVDTPPVSASAETLAALYQQQVLAGLSERVGSAAAEMTPDAMLPERREQTDAAFTPPEGSTPADTTEDGRRTTTLDLPPATVGPLSLRMAAAAGDPSAEFEVAARLAEGKGTNQNFKEAVRWYQRSAAQGFTQAQYRIGTMYERGLGVTKDIGRARVWYQRAAEQGNVKSMHNLAVLSAGGAGGSPDYSGATGWFLKAAEHGLPDSQYNLAVLFENGFGVQKDDKAAYKWYALAARGGDKDATERRDALKATFSAHDLKLAESLVAGFAPKPIDPLANDARAAGEDWKKRANSN